MGTTGLTARAVGAGDFHASATTLYRSLALALTMGLLLLLLSRPIADVVLRFMDADGDTAALATTYFRICIFGAPAVMVSYTMSGWFLGMQNSRAQMWVAIATNVINIAASATLVFGLGWKIEGVATGTLVAQWAGAAVAAAVIMVKYHPALPPLREIFAIKPLLSFFRINTDIFGSVQVIASTLVGSASRQLTGMRFSTVFIDEAAQALEAACWIPMRRAGRIILAGDHCQLPPTVKSFEAMKGGLGRSLMETIIERHPECVTLLTMQYRMHSDIMRFSSEYFYGGQLTAAPEVRDRGILDLDIPVEWVDTSAIDSEATDDMADFREAVAGENYGRINRAEARLTIDTLTAYIERIGRQRIIDERIDIGIISPYRAQVRYLRYLVKHQPWAKQLRGLVSVNTVDGFQGQERDVIVISLVRSNDKGDIGFLRDLRRTNVAMTRARMKLLIIGDSTTLRAAHPFYRRLYRYIEALKG